jgi:hypothetical protein
VCVCERETGQGLAHTWWVVVAVGDDGGGGNVEMKRS